jgi:hypothetical protein
MAELRKLTGLGSIRVSRCFNRKDPAVSHRGVHGSHFDGQSLLSNSFINITAACARIATARLIALVQGTFICLYNDFLLQYLRVVSA